MNDRLSKTNSLTRKLTDAALVLIAVAAMASWLWRRIRKMAAVDMDRDDDKTNEIDDKIGAAVGFPTNSTSP